MNWLCSQTLLYTVILQICHVVTAPRYMHMSIRNLVAQAFEEGGGGARAVAQRILAEAKAVASQKPKTEGPDPR